MVNGYQYEFVASKRRIERAYGVDKDPMERTCTEYGYGITSEGTRVVFLTGSTGFNNGRREFFVSGDWMCLLPCGLQNLRWWRQWQREG